MKTKVLFLALLALSAAIILSGCFGPTVQKPAPEGKLCDYNMDCAAESFFSCDKSYGNIQPDPDSEMYYQVIGTEGDKCNVYIQLKKAKDVPEFMYGMDAICKVTPAELAEKFVSGGNIDISKMNCTGPLYEAAKAAQALSGQ